MTFNPPDRADRIQDLADVLSDFTVEPLCPFRRRRTACALLGKGVDAEMARAVFVHDGRSAAELAQHPRQMLELYLELTRLDRVGATE